VFPAPPDGAGRSGRRNRPHANVGSTGPTSSGPHGHGSRRASRAHGQRAGGPTRRARGPTTRDRPPRGSASNGTTRHHDDGHPQRPHQVAYMRTDHDRSQPPELGAARVAKKPTARRNRSELPRVDRPETQRHSPGRLTDRLDRITDHAPRRPDRAEQRVRVVRQHSEPDTHCVCHHSPPPQPAPNRRERHAHHPRSDPGHARPSRPRCQRRADHLNRVAAPEQRIGRQQHMSPTTRQAPRPPRRTALLTPARPSNTPLTSPTPWPQPAPAITLQQASTQRAFDLDIISPYHPHQCLRAPTRTLSKSPSKVIIERVPTRSAEPSPITPHPRQPTTRPHQTRRHAPHPSSPSQTVNSHRPFSA
jgi:hypothetical protein